MQEEEDGSSDGLSILDEFFMTIPVFSPNASRFNFASQARSVEADVSEVVQYMIAIVESNEKTPPSVWLEKTPFWKSTVASITPHYSPPKTIEVDDGFMDASVQVLEDNTRESNIPKATLNLINYIKTRKSFSRPDNGQTPTHASIDHVMEETIDATAPEIIIDSVLFLESHNNKNEGLFKVRVLPLKVERLTSDNLTPQDDTSQSGTNPKVASQSVSDPTKDSVSKTRTDIPIEEETPQKADKASGPESPISTKSHELDVEFLTNLSLRITSLEKELKIGKERCGKMQEAIIDQYKTNNENIEMFRVMEGHLSFLKSSITEREKNTKPTLPPTRAASNASDSSVIEILSDEEMHEAVTSSSRRNPKKPSNADSKKKLVAGAALRRSNVIKEVKERGSNVQPDTKLSRSFSLRKRNASVTPESYAIGTTRKKKMVVLATGNVKCTESTKRGRATEDSPSATDGEVRAWYWSPHQPTRAEITKTTSTSNVRPSRPSFPKTPVDASGVNITFKSLDIYNKCPYCWGEHTADKCEMYPLLEQRERVRSIMMLCRKCLVLHPNRPCVSDQGWPCSCCDGQDHNTSLCGSKAHIEYCMQHFEEVLEKGLCPLEQRVDIEWVKSK